MKGNQIDEKLLIRRWKNQIDDKKENTRRKELPWGWKDSIVCRVFVLAPGWPRVWLPSFYMVSQVPPGDNPWSLQGVAPKQTIKKELLYRIGLCILVLLTLFGKFLPILLQPSLEIHHKKPKPGHEWGMSMELTGGRWCLIHFVSLLLCAAARKPL